VKKILGQPSWRIAAGNVEAYLTQLGGHLGPVRFGKIQPFSVAPWAEEKLDPATPAILRVLRGDFFCLPFGGNTTPYRGERHPIHGETANAQWKLESLTGDSVHASLRTRVRAGRVDKFVLLRPGHNVVYQRHVVSAMTGPMSFGHHAMLKFPVEPGSGVISTSRFTHGQVLPVPFEQPANRGYSALKPGARFTSLRRVPALVGGTADLRRYPARAGFEDLVMLISDDSLPFAWTAVTFPRQRYVWFALKDPRVLTRTVFWISNGGRHYPPWNGRHVSVLGVEEVTSHFHYGLAESVRAKACRRLDPRHPLAVNYIMAVAPIPANFDRVTAVRAGNHGVTLRAASGTSVLVPLDLEFLLYS
jgi:hypothetical protein